VGLGSWEDQGMFRQLASRPAIFVDYRNGITAAVRRFLVFDLSVHGMQHNTPALQPTSLLIVLYVFQITTQSFDPLKR
jgi:hypothetical protein